MKRVTRRVLKRLLEPIGDLIPEDSRGNTACPCSKVCVMLWLRRSSYSRNVPGSIPGSSRGRVWSEEDAEPLTARDEQVGTLHGSFRHQGVNW